MAKYIKGKDGKFTGSIGDGKNKIPTEAPAVPAPVDLLANATATMRADIEATAQRFRDFRAQLDAEDEELDGLDLEVLEDEPVEAELVDDEDDAEEMGSDVADLSFWTKGGSEVIDIQWERHVLPNGEKMIASAGADSPLLGIIYQPPGADFYKADLDTMLPNGTLSGEPMTTETFSDQPQAKRWVEFEIRRREREVIDFLRDYEDDPAGIRDQRRDHIRRLGDEWSAVDTSAGGRLSAEFRFEDRITTIAQDDKNGFTVIVGLTDGYDDDYPAEVMHIRSFRSMAEAVDFAEEMTLIGN